MGQVVSEEPRSTSRTRVPPLLSVILAPGALFSPGSVHLSLASFTRFLEMLMFSEVGENSRLFALLFETSQRTLKRLVIPQPNTRHATDPLLGSRYGPQPGRNMTKNNETPKVSKYNLASKQAPVNPYGPKNTSPEACIIYLSESQRVRPVRPCRGLRRALFRLPRKL